MTPCCIGKAERNECTCSGNDKMQAQSIYAIPKVGTVIDIGSFAYKVRKITKTDIVLRAFDFSDAQKLINESEQHGGLILPR